MKKILTLIPFILILCLTGCSADNKWEIRQTIKPEILNQSGDNISIKYNLGPFIILDDIQLKNTAQALYIFKTKDVFELNVVVKYSDGWAASNGFYYYFNESKIGGSYPTKPITLSKLQKAELEMPGFKWLIKNTEKAEKSIALPKKKTPDKVEILQPLLSPLKRLL